MKKRCLKKLEYRILLKYTIGVFALALGGFLFLYIFDNILNGIIIDFLKVLASKQNPFLLFRKLFVILLPILIVITSFILLYFLVRELIQYLHFMIEGMDDIFAKKRTKLNLPKEMQQTQKVLLNIADEYQQYRIAAKEEEDKKKDLIYVLAQDVKLPLSNILMYLEFLEKEQEISNRIRKEFLVKVLQKSMDLEDMMNEFFDITKFNLKYSKMQIEHMYIDRMIAQVLDESYDLIDDKDIAVSFQCDKTYPYKGDTEKLARVIRDLLKNLIILGNQKGKILISLDDQGEFYHIHMEGDAKHLSAYQIAHIFHNYYRLEEMNKNERQYMIGLGVTKQIIEMHKGIIFASSIENRLQFMIDLPKSIE